MIAILWRNLPLLLLAYLGVGAAWMMVVNAEPPRHDLLVATILPLVPVGAVAASRWRQRDADARLGAAVAVAAPALVLLIGISGLRYAISDPALLLMVEVSGLFNAALVGAHAAWRGRDRLVLFYGPVALYGLVLENGGIMLGYFAEPDYQVYLGPLPASVSNITGWVLVLYLSFWAVDELRQRLPSLRHSAFMSAIAVTAVALLQDGAIDALAQLIGMWQWHPALTPGWLGVPVLNWVAWSCAVFPFALAMYRCREQPPPAVWVLRRLPLVLTAASILFVAAMALLEGGFDGPTFTILREMLATAG